MINIKSDNVFCFFKGRIALYAILKAAGLKKGDEVILPGFTCVVAANAVKYLGARCVYADIDPADYNLDPEDVEKKITARTRVLIVQHTFGIPCAMDRLLAVARKRSLFVIEDAAHALGSSYCGKPVGTLADASFFSTQWSKPVTTGLGGYAVINNPSLLKRMREEYAGFRMPSSKDILMLALEYCAYRLLYHPATFWILMGLFRALYSADLILGSSSSCELNMEKPRRYEMRMSGFQKRLLEKQSGLSGKISAHRDQITRLYREGLEGSRHRPLTVRDHDAAVLLRYPLLVSDKAAVLSRARKKQLEIGDWFVSPLHPVTEGLEKLDYRKGMCPKAEEVCAHIINLPTHAGVSPGIAGRILDFILDCAPYKIS